MKAGDNEGAMNFTRLKLAMADELMSLSEKEFSEEMSAEGASPEDAKQTVLSAMRRALYEASRRRATINELHRSSSDGVSDSQIRSLDPERARAALRAAVERCKVADTGFLMAARNEAEVSDDEIRDMLLNLRDLGLLLDQDLE